MMKNRERTVKLRHSPRLKHRERNLQVQRRRRLRDRRSDRDVVSVRRINVAIQADHVSVKVIINPALIVYQQTGARIANR